ncbi:branched-chain amino acid ABC transporter permease [Thermodesulfobacteriota bacterium]
MPSGLFKTRYIDDMALLETTWKKLWLVVFFVFLAVLPLVAGYYIISLINLTLITIIAALGLNLLIGNTGQISLGNAAFLAIGSYTAGSFAVLLNVPFWLAVPLGGFAAMIVGLVVGIPALRIKGFYLLLATFALHFITESTALFYQVKIFGPAGLRFPVPEIGPLMLDTPEKFYCMLVVVCSAAVLFLVNIMRTQEGRTFMAVRDHDIAAMIIGVNVTRTKLAAFALSSFYVGIAGALYGYYLGNISAEIFHLMLAVDHLAMIIIGGMGSIFGSIAGTIFVVLFPHVIPEFINLVMSFSSTLGSVIKPHEQEIRTAMMGVIILVVLIFKPEGLNGLYRDIKIYFRNWPYKY